ncbi:MAG: TRL domain-containing protein [Leptospiraceae bacterium]|nr:TRL domain-containing protein [Leptospiraceae bacterium]
MKLTLTIIIFSFLTSCASGPVSGLLFTYTKYAGEENLDSSIPPTAEGESCQYSILTLFSYGDSSAGTAADNGGILRIATVDHSTLSVLTLLFIRNCTIVRGATY